MSTTPTPCCSGTTAHSLDCPTLLPREPGCENPYHHWTTVEIADQFQRFVRKPELDADAQWVSAAAFDRLRTQVRELEAERDAKCDHGITTVCWRCVNAEKVKAYQQQVRDLETVREFWHQTEAGYQELVAAANELRAAIATWDDKRECRSTRTVASGRSGMACGAERRRVDGPAHAPRATEFDCG